ncbi:unnamed protein product, partial [Pylaiella littoralis]
MSSRRQFAHGPCFADEKGGESTKIGVKRFISRVPDAGVTMSLLNKLCA